MEAATNSHGFGFLSVSGCVCVCLFFFYDLACCVTKILRLSGLLCAEGVTRRIKCRLYESRKQPCSVNKHDIEEPRASSVVNGV